MKDIEQAKYIYSCFISKDYDDTNWVFHHNLLSQFISLLEKQTNNEWLSDISLLQISQQKLGLTNVDVGIQSDDKKTYSVGYVTAKEIMHKLISAFSC